MNPNTLKPYTVNDQDRGEKLWPNPPEKEKKVPEDMCRKKLSFLFTENMADDMVAQIPKGMRGDYIEALRQVVKGPGVGGSGQYLGSLEPLVFATRAQKIEAIELLNKWNEDSYNK